MFDWMWVLVRTSEKGGKMLVKVLTYFLLL